MSLAALTVSGISRSFGTKRAVDDVSFSIGRGEITGFLGPNGAGKTTVMGMIMGLVTPDSGTIELLGVSEGSRLPAMRLRIGYLQERPRVYPEMTARGYLRFFADLYGVPGPAERVREVLDRVGLTAAADRRLGGFSRGMSQRACLARVMLHRPELLMLDEPTLGLDPNGVADMRAIFRDMRAEGTTLFFSSHQLAEMERICDKVVFMRAGRVVAADRPDAIMPAAGALVAECLEPPEETLAALAGSAAIRELAPHGPHHIRFSLADQPSDLRLARAQAARLLTSAGLNVLSVQADQRNLEDLFISLTRPDPDGPHAVAVGSH